MSFFQYFNAIAKKQLATVTAKPLITTKTPLDELSQRSLVTLDMVPIVLAKAAGSLFDKPLVKDGPERDIANGQHHILAVSKMRYIGFDFYRCYLSKDDGSFIHLCVNPAKPTEIIECRLYQPYNEISPLWKDREEEVRELGNPQQAMWRSADTDYPVTVTDDDALHGGVEYVFVEYVDAGGATHKTGVPKIQITYEPAPIDDSLNWSFWLLDDPDPNVGGMIGCPIMQGKDEDGGIQYARTWVASDARISPVTAEERMIDVNADITVVNHTMMHYSRQLNNDKIEYMLVSAVEIQGENRGYVSQWLGLDISPSGMMIFGVSATPAT